MNDTQAHLMRLLAGLSLCIVAGACGDPGEEGSSDDGGMSATSGTTTGATTGGTTGATTGPPEECEALTIEAPRTLTVVAESPCPGAVVDDEGACLVEEPAPPQEVERQRWSCPEGWTERTALELREDAGALDEESQALLEGTRLCTPPTPPESCPRGFMAVLGQSECQPIGAACPEGEPWPSEDALRQRLGSEPSFEGAVRYVSTEGDPDTADGTRERPFAAVAAAVEAAEEGDIVAVGAGDFVEEIVLDRRLALVGACARDTILSAPSASDEQGVVRISAAGGGAVSDVTVRGRRPGVEVTAEAMGSVVIQSMRTFEAVSGVLVRGAPDVRLADILFTDGQVRQFNSWGRALMVVQGGVVQGERLTFEDNQDVSVYATDEGTRVTLTDTLIRRTEARESIIPQLDGTQGVALGVIGAAVFEGERLWMDSGHTLGAVVQGEGTQATLTDTIISNTEPQPSDRQSGRGLSVLAEASLQGERIWLHRNHDYGLIVDGASASVTDLVVTDTQPDRARRESGVGVGVVRGASARVTRVLVDQSYTAGVGVEDSQSRGVFTDLIVHDTQPQPSTGLAGRGLNVVQLGTVEVERAIIDLSHELGVIVDDRGASAVLTDAIVRRTQPLQTDMSSGAGVAVVRGGSAELSRVRVERNHTIGISVERSDSEATLTDVVIADTAPQQTAIRDFGRGLNVFDTAQVVAERLLVERNHEIGVAVASSGTRATISGLIARDNLPVLDRNGSGVIVFGGAEAEVTGAVFSNNHTFGAGVEDEGSRLTLTDAAIFDTQPANLEFGRGLNVGEGAELRGERLLLERNHEAGVIVGSPGSQATLADVVVRRTLSNPFTQGGLGAGLVVTWGGSLTGERIVLEENQTIGLFVHRRGTQATLTDLRVERTLEGTINGWEGGQGVLIGREAHATLERFEVTDNALSGIHLSGATMEGRQGLVRGNFTGFNIATPGFDPAEHMSCVEISENCCGASCEAQVCNVEYSDLPIPESDIVTSIDPDNL